MMASSGLNWLIFNSSNALLFNSLDIKAIYSFLLSCVVFKNGLFLKQDSKSNLFTTTKGTSSPSDLKISCWIWKPTFEAFSSGVSTKTFPD